MYTVAMLRASAVPNCRTKRADSAMRTPHSPNRVEAPPPWGGRGFLWSGAHAQWEGGGHAGPTTRQGVKLPRPSADLKEMRLRSWLREPSNQTNWTHVQESRDSTPHVRKISLHPIGFAAARINQPPHDLVRAVRIRVRRNHHQNKLTTIDVVEIHQIVGLARVRTPHFQSVDLVDTTLRATDRVPVERNPSRSAPAATKVRISDREAPP